MMPMYLENMTDSVTRAISHVKDCRSQTPTNGWDYFSGRFLSAQGKQRFAHHGPVEILFNYLGIQQQLEKADSLFQPIPRSERMVYDVGEEVPRQALFEISAQIEQGVAQFTFNFSRRMAHRDRICSWIQSYQTALTEALHQLSRMAPQPTLVDFPLLKWSYSGLDLLVEQRMPLLGVAGLDELEDVYPVSPMQQGLLLTQSRGEGAYKVQYVFEVSGSTQQAVDGERLLSAWEVLVARHPILRTVFIDSVSDNGVYDQIVLKQPRIRSTLLEAASEQAALELLQAVPLLDYGDPTKPPHQLAICRIADGTNKIVGRLEANHAIFDAASLGGLLRDWDLAYNGKLHGTGPRYSSYIAHIQSKPEDVAYGYWKGYLDGLEPSIFPVARAVSNAPKEIHHVSIDLASSAGRLGAFCDRYGVSIANVFQLIWAMVLRCYTGSEDVCFGYLTSGRDVPLEGVEDMVGPLINMLVCRMNNVGAQRGSDVAQTLQVDFMAALEYQHCSLAEIQHARGLGGRSLFNSVMTIQRSSQHQPASRNAAGLSFRTRSGHDPSEYDLTIGAVASEAAPQATLGYWSTALSKWQANNIAATFATLFHSLLESPEQSLGELSPVGAESMLQLDQWTGSAAPPAKIDRCMHQVFEEQAVRQPARPAICAWDASFTYEELDRVSTDLAHHLVSLGVQAETMVPICMEKSAWTIVAMLAILKAGGAFVPLDPSHPLQRRQGIVEQLNSDVVVVSPETRENRGLGAEKTIVEVSPALIAGLPSPQPETDWSSTRRQQHVSHLHLRQHWETQGSRD
ncbi:hypothetical protein N7533_011624 [Penicillium manginii]|uniref:uncharacterized protein n=1 Tax=Penicillium manginii TaxID=203109 RepID=UPI002546846F|nr:uncharacterized protein N7533_011624 [Penicillium manginii]KAJ5742215.1 hypothetical protein N7533_011624 [Penicillium manginii]